jgi:hypothetical protein
LAYFFGFFGISFLDTDAISRGRIDETYDDTTNSASQSSSPAGNNRKLEPRNDTLICAEKSSGV